MRRTRGCVLVMLLLPAQKLWVQSPPGHRAAPLLQEVKVFLKDFDEGLYKSHYDLVTTHYIAPDKP